jgi:hypothetical protein
VSSPSTARVYLDMQLKMLGGVLSEKIPDSMPGLWDRDAFHASADAEKARYEASVAARQGGGGGGGGLAPEAKPKGKGGGVMDWLAGLF